MKTQLDFRVVSGVIVGVLVLVAVTIYVVSGARKAPPVDQAKIEATKLQVEQEVQAKGKQ